MLLGYNTNGLTHHRLIDAIDLLADIGYQAIAISLDHSCLDPFSPHAESECTALRHQLEQRKLTPVVETGARYLLDPRRKHWPTLISDAAEDRARRFDLLHRSMTIAKQVGSGVVSFWSGTADGDATPDALYDRLADQLIPLLELASQHHVQLALEPEPDMLIATLDDFVQLDGRLSSRGVDSGLLKITLDIGHLHCQGETPIADKIRQFAPRIANVHIEDMPRNAHDHRLFGAGDIEFPPIIDALLELPDDTPVCVELSRHSHMGPEAAEQSFGFLHKLL